MASIWLGIRGSCIRVKKFDFSRQISENFDFFRQFHTKNSIFQAKIDRLQLLLGKLFYFSSKVNTLELTYVLYMIIIFHDPSTTPTTPMRPHDPSAQNLWVATSPSPQD